MNRLEHLLTISAEECNEVAQRATKALRFGLREVQPGQPLDNAERIRQEFNDLWASLDMVEKEKGMPTGTLTGINMSEVFAKQDKIEEFLLLSAKEGTLTPGAPAAPATCKARQQSDEMYCAPCGLRWDVNDPHPPLCQPTGRR